CGDFMRLALRVLVVLALATLVGIIFQQRREAAERAGWDHFAEAHDQGMTVAALETAKDQAKGSPAEPWLNFELALKLYEQGTSADLERASQIAKEAESQFSSHPAGEACRKLQAAISSFQSPAPPAAGG